MDRAYRMSQELARGTIEQSYRGPRLFTPLTPFDAFECPDCTAPPIVQLGSSSARPSSSPAPTRRTAASDETGGSLIDDGIPRDDATTAHTTSWDHLIARVRSVATGRNEEGLGRRVDSNGFTLVNGAALEDPSLSWRTAGNVVVFVMHQDFQRIVHDVSKTLDIVEAGVAVNKHLIVLGLNPNMDCSVLPCLDAKTQMCIRTRTHGETTLPDALVNVVTLMFASALAARELSVKVKGPMSKADDVTQEMENAVKALLDNDDCFEVYHVKRSS